MREIVATCALLGALVELLATLGGPQAAGTGVPNELAPAMPTGPFLVGLAAAGLAVIAGLRIGRGHSGKRWGLVLLVCTAVGIVVVSPWTGWFTIAAVFVLLAGVLALFIRPGRSR